MLYCDFDNVRISRINRGEFQAENGNAMAYYTASLFDDNDEFLNVSLDEAVYNNPPAKSDYVCAHAQVTNYGGKVKIKVIAWDPSF